MRPRIFLSFIAIIVSLFVSSSYSQQSQNNGAEKDLSQSDLSKKASQTDFKSTFVAEIFKDEKNTYFAIDNSTIKSKYVKIRILELVFSDSKIVNIGSSIDEGYMLFLVNNILVDRDKEIMELFNSYKSIAQKEEASMDKDEMTLWMKNRNKYHKK